MHIIQPVRSEVQQVYANNLHIVQPDTPHTFVEPPSAVSTKFRRSTQQAASTTMVKVINKCFERGSVHSWKWLDLSMNGYGFFYVSSN